jgi:hypothetical protein
LRPAPGIFDLRERPHHAAAVAERIGWRIEEETVGKAALTLYSPTLL